MIFFFKSQIAFQGGTPYYFHKKGVGKSRFVDEDKSHTSNMTNPIMCTEPMYALYQ